MDRVHRNPVTREQAEQDLRDWAANNARRDDLVRTARRAGVSKNRIHTLTGIARSTIDRIEENAMATDVAHTAATIIARARDAHGSSDAFDFQIAAEGIKPFGELYNEAYVIANANMPVRTGDAAERKARAVALWEQVLPELEQYAAGCKAAEYTGWSTQSKGPIRRVR